MMPKLCYSKRRTRAYSAQRVIRGGSYWNEAGDCRSAYRGADEPGARDRYLGFRLAAGQEPRRGAPSPAAVGAVAPGPEAPAAGPASGASPAQQEVEDAPVRGQR